MEHIAYIGIGSNLGDKVAHCNSALHEVLSIDRHKLLAQSSLYKTEPLGYRNQDWFVNCVIKIETQLEALDLLYALKAIESRLGRRETFRWGPRVIDLDILFFDDRVMGSVELNLPHPHLHERQFVLIPLAEIDRSIVHPVLRKTVGDLLDGLPEDQGVERIVDTP